MGIYMQQQIPGTLQNKHLPPSQNVSYGLPSQVTKTLTGLASHACRRSEGFVARSFLTRPPHDHGEGTCDKALRTSAFYIDFMDQLRFLGTYPSPKGRTIRKMMGGVGNFQLARFFFFAHCLCGNFFL